MEAIFSFFFSEKKESNMYFALKKNPHFDEASRLQQTAQTDVLPVSLSPVDVPRDLKGQLVGWCFKPSHSHRILKGLKINFYLSPGYSAYKPYNHTILFTAAGLPTSR